MTDELPSPEHEPGNRIEIGSRSRELLTVFCSPPDQMDPTWHLSYSRDSNIQGRKWADILALVVGIAHSECTSGAPWEDILDAIEDECRRVRAACQAFERGDPDEPRVAPPRDNTSEDEALARDVLDADMATPSDPSRGIPTHRTWGRPIYPNPL